jgi:hypothetical protein
LARAVCGRAGRAACGRVDAAACTAFCGTAAAASTACCGTAAAACTACCGTAAAACVGRRQRPAPRVVGRRQRPAPRFVRRWLGQRQRRRPRGRSRSDVRASPPQGVAGTMGLLLCLRVVISTTGAGWRGVVSGSNGRGSRSGCNGWPGAPTARSWPCTGPRGPRGYPPAGQNESTGARSHGPVSSGGMPPLARCCCLHVQARLPRRRRMLSLLARRCRGVASHHRRHPGATRGMRGMVQGAMAVTACGPARRRAARVSVWT